MGRGAEDFLTKLAAYFMKWRTSSVVEVMHAEQSIVLEFIQEEGLVANYMDRVSESDPSYFWVFCVSRIFP